VDSSKKKKGIPERLILKVGSLSQFFWFIQADKPPTRDEALAHYSHLDVFTPEIRSKLMQFRKKFRKAEQEAKKKLDLIETRQ